MTATAKSCKDYTEPVYQVNLLAYYSQPHWFIQMLATTHAIYFVTVSAKPAMFTVSVS